MKIPALAQVVIGCASTTMGMGLGEGIDKEGVVLLEEELGI